VKPSLHNPEAMRRRERAQRERMQVHLSALDVSALPSFGFGHRSLMWWGTLGLMAIEGTAFALAVAGYLYLHAHATEWPMSAPPPGLLWGTLNLCILLLSIWPNHWTKQAAEKLDLGRVRRGLLVCLVFALAFLVVRVFEFRSLEVGWDQNAYGSIVWLLLGLHTAHQLTDAYDTTVLTVLMHTGPIEGKRFVDVSENSLYWYFVVWSWVPMYAVIYLVPRL
jgi:cytochrome c oxidase subunit 3